MNAKIYITLLFLLFPFITKAYESVTEADSAYNAKDYGRAVELYKGLIEEEGTSSGLLFNLGNSYFQLGDYGNAMLYWERAKLLAPARQEINDNIKYLQSRVEDANKAELKGRRLSVVPDALSFFGSVHKSLTQDVSSNRWAVWGAVFFILFIGATALYIFSRQVLLRKIGFFGGFSTLIISIIFISISFMGAHQAASTDRGVVMSFKVSLLTEPGKESDSGKGNVLTKGTIVNIVSEEQDVEGNVIWYKIRLNSDFIGWIPAKSLEII